MAGEELDARAALHALGAQHGKQAHLTRVRDVRATAGRVVEVADGNHAEWSVDVRHLAQLERLELGRRWEPCTDLDVPRDQFVRDVCCVRDRRVGERGLVHVDRHRLGAEVESDRRGVGGAEEGLGEDMLSRVLLHVVEASHCVDRR